MRVRVHLVEFKLDWTQLGTREPSLVWGYRLKLLHFLLEVKMTQLVWRVTIGTYLIQQTLSLEVNHWLCMRGMSCLSIKKTSKSESKHCHLSKFLYYVKKIVWGRLIEKTQYYRKINLSRSFTFYQYLFTCLPVLNKRFPGGPSNVKGHPNQALCWNQRLRLLRGWGWEGRVLQDGIFWERSRQTDRGEAVDLQNSGRSSCHPYDHNHPPTNPRQPL